MTEIAPFTDLILDAGRTSCGDLVLLIVQRMKGLVTPQVLHVIGYDRGAAEDIPAWCRMTNNVLVYQDIPQDRSQPLHFYIQKG